MSGRILMSTVFTMVLLTFSVSATTQPEAPQPPLSLSAAVERALGSFPSIQASRAGGDQARASLGESAAARFPSLKLNASATRYERPMVVTPIHGFGPGQIPNFDDTLYQGGVGLSFTLFDGGAREARIRGARSQVGSAEADLDATSQALIARVVSTYLETLSQQQVLDAHDRRLVALRSEQSRVQKRFDAGSAARVEILRVQAVLANAEADRVKSAEALERAERDLARLINAPVEEIKASGLVPVFLSDPSVASRDFLKMEALQFSPAVKQARERVAVAEASVTIARSAWWPELNLVGNYLYFGSSQDDGKAEWNAGAQLSYILFNGGARVKAIARAESAGRNADQQLRLAEIQVDQDLDRALSAINEAHARVESLETAVARFEEVARIEKLLRETGTGTETDYLNAEADLLTTRASLVEARHGEIAARVELVRVIGQLNPAWLRRTVGDRP